MIWHQVGHWMHGPRDIFIPSIAEVPEVVPLLESILQSHSMSSRIGISKSWYRSPKVCDFGHDIENLVCPLLLGSSAIIASHAAVKSPIVRIPCYLPVEVKAAEELHSDVEPKASSSNTRRFRIPTALFDECSCAGDMIHSLESSF